MKKALVIICFVLIVCIGFSQQGRIEVEIRYGKSLRGIKEIQGRLQQVGFTNVVVSLSSLRSRRLSVVGRFVQPDDLARVGRIIDEFDGRYEIDRDLRLDAMGSNGSVETKVEKQ